MNSALAGGMDWPSLHKLIKDERRAGNPVAQLIHALDLENNCATLILSNLLDDEEENEDDGAPFFRVHILVSALHFHKSHRAVAAACQDFPFVMCV